MRCDTTEAAGIEAYAAQLAGESTSIAIDAGGFLGTASLSRLVLDRDAEALATSVAATHVRGFALDQDDLAMPRATLLRAARAFDAHAMPLLLGNVRCVAGGEAICASTRGDAAPLIIDSPSGPIAIVTAVTPSVAATIARDRADGLVFVDPSLSIGVATATARAAGARYVIAIYDPAVGHELDDALAVAHAIPPRSSPDVLLVRRIARHVRTITVPGHITQIVAVEDAAPFVLDAIARPEPRPARMGRVPDEIHRFAEDTHAWLCRELDRPNHNAPLDTPLDRTGFATLLLDVMRERTHADVAIINRGAVDSRAGFPLRDSITPLDVAAALPFDNPLRVTRMTATELNTFLSSAEARRFFVRGAALEDSHVRINGRPTDEGVRYRVVTIDFVAEGGDGGLPTTFPYLPVASDTLRDVLGAWLARPHHPPLLGAPLDPARRTLWVFRSAIDTTFGAVVVNNPNNRVFTDAQLTRTPSATGRLDLELHADAFHPLYRLENGVRLLYGATISTPAGMPVTTIETADLITGRSTGVWRGLLSARRVWYRPRPFIDTYVESEFTRPVQRRYHHLELRPTIGLRFEASDRLSFNIGGGLSWEVFATPLDLTPPGNPSAPTLTVGYVLRPGNVFSIGSHHAEGESSLDIAWRDPLGQPSAQVRFRARVSIPLFEPVALTLSYEMYARYARYFDDEGFVRADWALSTDVNIGLKITFARAVQAFRF